MKKKFHHLVFSGIMIVAVLAAGLWWRYAPRPDEFQKQRIQLAPMPPINMPSPQVLSEIDRFQHRLERLAAAAVDRPAGGIVDLRSFGYRVQRSVAPAVTAAGVFQPNFPAYALTFAFASKNKQFCIIDGALHTTGDKLPDGGRVVKIEGRRVLIQKEAVRKWVDMQAPQPPAGDKKRDEEQTISREG